MDFNEAMQEVLKQSKYDRLAGRLFDWRAWLRDRALELLRRILESLNIDFSSLFQPGASGWARNWLNVLRALGIVLAAFLAVRLALYIRKRARQRRNKAGGVFEGIDRDSATAGGLLEAGWQLAADGYPRDAVRYCLAAVLLALDKKRICRLHDSKTNGQILRELRGKSPAMVPALAALVNAFNAVWFGHRDITQVQFDKYWRDSSSLVAEVEAYK